MKQRLTTLVFSALVAGSMVTPAAFAQQSAQDAAAIATLASTETTSSISLTCFPHGRAPVEYASTWGAPRSGGRGHTGVDLMTPRGHEVYAVADGVVETMRNGSRSGYYVRLSHDDGAWETWYMHLNNDTPGTDDGRGGADAAYAPGLDVGDTVKAGDVIGYVGDSGNAEWTGTHTHFELHIDGRKVNPYEYLVAAEERMHETYAVVKEAALATDVGPDRSEVGALWGWLVESGTDACLSDGYKDLVEHLFGELPSESVLLTGMEAR